MNGQRAPAQIINLFLDFKKRKLLKFFLMERRTNIISSFNAKI